MRRYSLTFLILLPLTILISLPCSIKQDIKQLLGISVNASAQVEKSKINHNICVYTSIQEKKAKNNNSSTSSRSKLVNIFLLNL